MSGSFIYHTHRHMAHAMMMITLTVTAMSIELSCVLFPSSLISAL